jgi:ParB family transcriptional regulator, chromosome partitioning protein
LEINPKERTSRKGLRKTSVLDANRFDIRSVVKTYKQLPIDLLHPGIFQTRRNFKSRPLKELASSLDATGINITPLIIRPRKSGDGFEIICGERRWRAAQLSNLPLLLCCIGDFNDDQALYISGVDNIQREDLNPLEEAYAYELLLQTGMTHVDVSLEIGKSRAHVTHHLRLLQLPLAVRDLIADETLNYAQARPLCSLNAPGLQVSVALEAVKKRWTSKKIEDHVAGLNNQRRMPRPKEPISDDIDIKRLKEIVSKQTGYPCAIVKTDSGGWQLGLGASSIEEFHGILDRLGIDTESL